MEIMCQNIPQTFPQKTNKSEKIKQRGLDIRNSTTGYSGTSDFCSIDAFLLS
jgi:hypothetical protein